MQISSRQKVSFSWVQSVQIVEHIRSMDGLGNSRREQYSTAILLALASGLRCGELLALKMNDIDFKASTIRVDESSDQRNCGRIGECKNVAAYRTVYLGDPEGRIAMERLKQFLEQHPGPSDALIFHSKRGGPLLQTTIVNQGLYLALDALGLKKAGLHAFRRGCKHTQKRRAKNWGVIVSELQDRTLHYF
jgi:integrase